MKLIERVVLRPEILESNAQKLPEGVLCRVRYPVCNIGVRNHNNRKYSRDVWEKVHEDADISEKIRARNLFGHAEHPVETTQSNLEKTSHVVSRLFMEEGDLNGKSVMMEKADIDVLDTPYGDRKSVV